MFLSGIPTFDNMPNSEKSMWIKYQPQLDMYNAVSLVANLRNLKRSSFREHKSVHMWKLKQPKEKLSM